MDWSAVWAWVGEYLIPILVTGTGVGWVIELVRARSLNRKDKVEGSVLLLGSQAAYAQALMARVEALEAEREKDHATMLRQMTLLHRHAVWDHERIKQLAEALPGVVIPEPPPLFGDSPAA